MKKILTVLSGFILTVLCIQAQDSNQVKNIILLIGDGMGTTQIYAGYTMNYGNLELERAQYVGFSKTSSSNSYITDSGAGATAIATGKKTYNGAVGVNAEGQPEKTILESAVEMGYSTGVISTSSVTHATPASFVAHDTSRSNYENIAADFVNSGINLFIGGGKDNFEKRKDGRNLSEELKARGYNVIYELEQKSLKSDINIACLAADEHMPSMLKGRGDFLPKASKLAMDKLSENEKGFFLMIEGSQIDWGGHANDIDYVTSEVLDFDKTVGLAFDFADENPGTLVIVTADHETGGLSLIDGNISEGRVLANFGTTNHTSVMVPVFTYGTAADSFAGIYENTELFFKMMTLLNFSYEPISYEK